MDKLGEIVRKNNESYLTRVGLEPAPTENYTRLECKTRESGNKKSVFGINLGFSSSSSEDDQVSPRETTLETSRDDGHPLGTPLKTSEEDEQIELENWFPSNTTQKSEESDVEDLASPIRSSSLKTSEEDEPIISSHEDVVEDWSVASSSLETR